MESEITAVQEAELNHGNGGDGEPEDRSSEAYLDLTSFQLHDLGDIDIPETLVELDLTANRLTTLDARISRLSRLKKLSFRQNLFDDAGIAPISEWTLVSGLQELILRDNKLSRIPDVKIFKSLVVFDVSFNEINSTKGLADVSNLVEELYLSKNGITKMEELSHFHNLKILELGSNRLRVMENMETLTNLQELWLGRNRIKAVNLCGLKTLKKISLQSNRLTSMAGFQDCVALEELYLSHNGIEKMEGLSSLVNLRVLDISNNKLTAVEDISNLSRLEDLWLNDNQIPSLDGLDARVAASRETMTTIYLENNPCARLPEYVITLRKIFPKIQQIDADVFH
ncbi:leucine-rich repeat (LRR) family protein [Wolffia australiana]